MLVTNKGQVIAIPSKSNTITIVSSGFEIGKVMKLIKNPSASTGV